MKPTNKSENKEVSKSRELGKLDLSKLPSKSYVVEISPVDSNRKPFRSSVRRKNYASVNARKRKKAEIVSAHERNFENLKKELRVLKEEHENLIGLATELTTGLQNTISDQHDNLAIALNNCRVICPDLFQNYEVQETDSCKETLTSLDKNKEEPKLDLKKRNQSASTAKIGDGISKELYNSKSLRSSGKNFENIKEAVVQQQAPNMKRLEVELDFRKIRKDMLDGDEDTKTCIVRALRQRILNNKSDNRDQILSSYIRHDLLGLRSAPNVSKKSILEQYFMSNHPPMQEEMAKLLNVFASLTAGRNYLCQDETIIISLLIPLTVGNNDSPNNLQDKTHDIFIAILQKLSIRYKPRIQMISKGIVEYLVWFLVKNHQETSEYALEYGTALLMNLFLHQEAREKCYTFAKVLLNLMIDLLRKEQFNPLFINGILYHLLSDPFVNKEAHDLDLGKILQYLTENSKDGLKKQFELLYRIYLNGNESNECLCNPKQDSTEEFDFIESQLCGNKSYDYEDFLVKYELILPLHGMQISPNPPCLCQPITPFATLKEEEIFKFNISQQDLENPNMSKNIQESESPKSSYSTSPETFCEDTKQFYHKPSAKRGIFEQEKPKSNRILPSFLKKFTSKSEPQSPLIAKNVFESAYCKSAPPQNLSCGCINFCYKDALRNPKDFSMFEFKQLKGLDKGCEKCNKRNKYSCKCYDAIKAYADTIDNKFSLGKKTLEDAKTKNDAKQVGDVIGSHIIDKNTVSGLFQRSCSSTETEDSCCYKAVFKSRPKILRTPPDPSEDIS